METTTAGSSPQPARKPLGPIGSADLVLRLSLATPKDTAKGMFFNGALASVRTWLDDAAAARCQAASEEKRFIDFFNYPITSFLNLTFTAADLLKPKMATHEEVFRRFGRQATDDFLASTVGKMLLALAGKDPRRLLTAIPGGYKTAVSYGERAVEFVGDKRCRFTMKRDFMPHTYHEGVFIQVISALGVSNVKVVGQRLGTLDAMYDITWE
jgi:uncharacterized protein (TIGR02265 family)